MAFTDEDRARRLDAKRNNERVKLISTTLNAVSVAIIGAAVVLPLVDAAKHTLTLPKTVILILFAIALHLLAQAMFYALRSED